MDYEIFVPDDDEFFDDECEYNWTKMFSSDFSFSGDYDDFEELM